MIPENYSEKVYAGLLGKCIGVRLGAPVEPTVWTYERIRETYGDIAGYLKEYKNFAADDDVNGPIFFIRALYDYGMEREITSQDIGNTWLNYTRENKGFFWWGGYGTSTEHTAYLNLKNGVTAPDSGSILRNGEAVAEQIGGQIFIDSWGLIFPGAPDRAAMYGERAAAVSHDGNGIYGARFIAAAISSAFSQRDPQLIIKEALKRIPAESEYARVVRDVCSFHNERRGDFRACRNFLEDNFGYDRYPGICHIIPNAGVCILALLYGEGTLSRTVEIATMCGWDTDCNAGNVGTIMGVACGLEGIEEKYRRPINDFFAGSSISGSLNIMDLPTESKRLALLGYRMAGEKAPEGLSESLKDRDLYFDFYYPGSTHGFRTGGSVNISLSHKRRDGRGSLEVLLDRLPRYEKQRLFYKPFYRREDFSDERYSPAFSPQVYSGQSLSVALTWEPYSGPVPAISLYVRKTISKDILESRPFFPSPGKRQEQSWIIPDTEGEGIDEIGIAIENQEKITPLGRLYIHLFKTGGRGTQILDFRKESVEFGTITQTTWDGGAWMLDKEGVAAITPERNELYTGNYYTENIRLTVPVTPKNGLSHMVILRAKGRRHGYFLGFDGQDLVRLIKNDNGIGALAEVSFSWQRDKEYLFEAEAREGLLRLSVDGQKILEYMDKNPYTYGMYGLGQLSAGRTIYGALRAEELD